MTFKSGTLLIVILSFSEESHLLKKDRSFAVLRMTKEVYMYIHVLFTHQFI